MEFKYFNNLLEKFVLGSKEILGEMIDNNQENRRYTGLRSRIREVKGIW